MPFIHIHTAGCALDRAQIEMLHADTTRLMAATLRKQAELTAVLVEAHDPARWAIGGVSVPRAAHLDVKITRGTNSAEEKGEFVRQAHALLSQVLGPDLPLATYVVIDEVAAECWGYGGLTQSARRAAARSAA